jgi:hypothetical protein
MEQYFRHRAENRGIKSKHLSSAGIMETGDHFKNGASPKSLMSRRNFKINNMTGKVLLYLVLNCALYFSVSAQDCSELRNNSEIRQELQDLASRAARDLMECCTSLTSGKNLSATIIWEQDRDGLCQTRISRLSGKIIITMKVSWTGSLTGNSYWIKGILNYDIDTGRRSWEKISDSGGFSPGCSNGCIN